LIEPTGDGIARYLREKLRDDTTPEMMSSALEANIMKSLPEISSKTYVETSARARLRKKYRRLIADIFESRFLLASLHIEAILRGNQYRSPWKKAGGSEGWGRVRGCICATWSG